MTNNLINADLLTCDEMSDLGMCVNNMLEQMEDDLGPEAVWALTAAYGGVSINLPQAQSIDTSIVTQKLGRAIVTWLCDHAGYGVLLIPLGPHGRTPRFAAQIRAERRNGLTQKAIAQKLQCSRRTVERHVQRLRNAGFIN